jgi:glycosyltransferase involved in cell wall biosynthesis
MNNSILFLSPLPPPSYGSALSSEMCLSILTNSNERITYYKLNQSSEFGNIGILSLGKVIEVLKLYYLVVKSIILFKYDLIYIVPATRSYGFFRDFILFITIKIILNNKTRIICHLRTRIVNNKMKNIIYNYCFKDTDIIILGESLKNEIKNYSSNIFVLPNAIESSICDDDIYKIIYNSNMKKIKILFLSNMIIEKGWVIVFDVVEKLVKMNFDVEATFAGSWPSDKEKNCSLN